MSSIKILEMYAMYYDASASKTYGDMLMINGPNSSCNKSDFKNCLQISI